MKGKLSVIAVLLFILSSAAYSRVLYVSSYNAGMFSSPDGSVQIMTLNKGAQLNVVSENDLWINAGSGDKTGWVKKSSTSDAAPGAKFTILGSAQNNARIHARRRASTDVTAASARGLTEDKAGAGRARSANSKQDEFDYQSLLKIENQHISDADLIKFLAIGGVRNR